MRHSNRAVGISAFFRFLALTALTTGIVSCGSNASSPTGPGDTPSLPDGSVVIDVVRENGAQSFSPNPATVAAGRIIVWHNIDVTTHRVVLNDGRLDTGNIPPGGFSSPTTLAAVGPYHCSIHPDMVGAINAPATTSKRP